MTTTHPDRTTTSSRRAWLTVAFLCLAELLLVVDITATNVALPSIGAELGLVPAQLSGVVTAYIVTFGGLMLLGGRLADRRGHRTMLLLRLAVFVAASALCGIATDGVVLLAGRALQGTGAALLSPAALAAVSMAFDGAARTRALGVWAGIGGLGFAAGLILSGALTAGPGWRWIFLINVPLGALVGIVFALLVPSRATEATRRLDVLGAVLGTLAAAGLVLALSISTVPHAAPVAAALLLATIGIAVAFARHERRHPSPLLPLQVLRRRSVLGGLVAMLFASGTMVGTFFVASLTVQDGLALDPLQTGLAFLAPALALVISAHVGGRFVAAVGPRVVGAAAFAMVALGAAVLAAGNAVGSLLVLEIGLVVVCLGNGAAFVVATTSALAEVEHGDAGATSGLVNTGHELGGAIGVAVATPALALGAAVLGSGAGALPSALAAIGAVAAAGLALVMFPRGLVQSAAGHVH